MKLMEENPAVELMKTFCKHYNERNLERLLSLFCKEHKVHCFGTGIDEDRHGIDGMKEQVLRDWAQSEKGTLLSPEFFYTSEDPICWAAGDFRAEITVSGEIVAIPHLRASICVIKEKEGWKISHMHASFPAQNQPAGSSFPAKAGLQSR